jgi:hypothetical protein
MWGPDPGRNQVRIRPSTPLRIGFEEPDSSFIGKFWPPRWSRKGGGVVFATGPRYSN